jgi:hypothetical protein
MHVWSGEMMLLIAGDSPEDAAREAKQVADAYPAFPWLADQAPKAWRRLSPDEPLTICDPTEPVTRTASDWARLRGRGLLAVPDYTTGQLGPWRGPEWLRTYKLPVRN